VNFGPLAAEIASLVWGTPGNFNGFRVLAVLLHGTLVVGISQTLRRWTEGATYIRQGGYYVEHWPKILALSSFLLLFSSPNLSGRRVDVYHTSTHGARDLSANLECRSKMCCTRLAGNIERKNDAKNRHLGTIAQLCQAESSQLRHVSTIGKKQLSSNMSSTCPYNMANFGPLAAEIVSFVWGTPANFNELSRIGSVTARHSASGRQSNLATYGWTEGATYIRQGGHHARALAHILFSFCNGRLEERFHNLADRSSPNFQGW